MNFATHQVPPGLDELDLTAFMIVTQHVDLNHTILPKHIIELDLPSFWSQCTKAIAKKHDSSQNEPDGWKHSLASIWKRTYWSRCSCSRYI
jgi:hypothetical protein